MITSIHTLIYSDDANATRAFLRDVLGWKYVSEDFDKDWLIFKSGPSETGVHPTHSEWEGQTCDHPRRHLIALMCDDIEKTVEELRAKGAQFRGPIEEREYGRIIMHSLRRDAAEKAFPLPGFGEAPRAAGSNSRPTQRCTCSRRAVA